MLRDQSLLTRAIWLLLLADAALSLIRGQWMLAFVSGATLVLSLAPLYLAKWAEIRIPPGFSLAIVIFIAGTLVLGESADFYNRFWWWDLVMHGVSAVGFGMIGIILMIVMFQGDRYAAPPWAMSFFAFCFAVTIGTAWEVFEYAMDQWFGTNMQKSGLPDTMGDLIVDMIGAALGTTIGFAYLKGQQLGGLTGLIADFVNRNPKFFKRLRK